MNILALDLGSSTGFAYYSRPADPVIAGTWVLETERGMRYARKLRMDRRLDPRVMALVSNLETLRRKSTIDWILFEDVKFGRYVAQVQLWSSFRGAIWAFAHLHGIQVDCLDTGKLKKFATGSGSADKPAMARALCARFPERYSLEKELVRDLKRATLLGDDAVDAIHLLHWAISLLKP